MKGPYTAIVMNGIIDDVIGYTSLPFVIRLYCYINYINENT